MSGGGNGTKEEFHFLNCIDPDCEKAYCVAQRDYQQQTAKQEMELWELRDWSGTLEDAMKRIQSLASMNGSTVHLVGAIELIVKQTLKVGE